MEVILFIAIIVVMVLAYTYEETQYPSKDVDTVPYKPEPWEPPRPRQEWVKPLPVEVINYHNYITSKRWHLSKARLETLLADNYSCRMCGSDECVEVHHITYANLGNELATDLVTLCRPCHQITHDTAGKGAGKYPPIRKR